MLIPYLIGGIIEINNINLIILEEATIEYCYAGIMIKVKVVYIRKQVTPKW